MFFYEGGKNLKKKLLTIFVCFLISFSFVGTISSLSLKKKSIDYHSINPDFTHNIIGEYFTMTTCVPCKYTHQALKELYAGEYHPFNYITFVYNKNNHSKMRKSELLVVGSPTTKFDGGYETVLGGHNTEYEKWRFNNSIRDCGNRTVNDIDLSLNVDWLGAVNMNPVDGKEKVPIEVVFNWTISEMKIDVEVTNNEASEYDGHLHIYVTENESEWWDDKFGNPYTHEFKDYAFNDDVTLDAGDTFSETIYWDGVDYNDADDPPRYFDHIKQDNIVVIAAVLDNDNNQYTDETAGVHTGGFHAGVFTDPKKFDVYFGDSYPPPKVIANGSEMKYDPIGDLNWSTDYFWKVDVWNANGDLTAGEDMTFTTRGENFPPNEPKPVFPPDGAENLSICYGAIEWNCSDPDGDELTYDIYFGESSPPPLIESNWSGNTYDPSPYEPTFEFETTYYWKIVAWDPFGESATGGIWEFKTEKNVPPNPAKDPIPPNGSRRVPVNIILCWNGSDPNLCDTLKYDVYFGLYDPPTQQTSYQNESCFDPYGPYGDLQIYETYYWKIVTWDKSGEKSIGPVWTFSTDPWCSPPPPEIDGPTQGKPEVIYEFDFVSDYFDNFSIIYQIEWGDGTMIESGPHEYGEIITLNHSWYNRGTYIIKARTKDENDVYSEWAFHKIVIPRDRSVNYNFDFFNLLFDRYPILIKLLSFFRMI